MAKAVSKIGTREQRKKLKPSGKPYLEAFERGFDIGYRKGQRGGSWVLRRYLGRERGYAVESIGRADDDANEARALSYEAAREVARKRMAALVEEPEQAGPPVTVARAIEEYIAGREAKEITRRGAITAGAGRKGLKKDAGSRLKHVDEKLASRSLAEITTNDLITWRENLRGMEASTVRRIANDFKAALNTAAKRHKVKLPPSIRDTIKDGLATPEPGAPPARDIQPLSDEDVIALVEAAEGVDKKDGWGGDLAIVVRVLAATGARFSQIIRMRVGDVLREDERLLIPTSFKGKGKKQKTHTRVPVAPDVIEALAKITAGRKAGEPLFLRPEKVRVTFTKWRTVGREPWYAAAELNRVWSKIVKEAKAERETIPLDTIPYALRHASIVRNLREGLGTEHVAQLHDTGEKMISAHYAANITTAFDKIAARAALSFAVKPSAPPPPVDSAKGKVVKLRAAS